MSLNKTKNLIITFFVFMAIYQTAKLWFEDFSSRSFFYYADSAGEFNSVSDEIKYSLEKIAINKGNGKFICKYNDIYSSEYKQIFDNAVHLTFEKGRLDREAVVDWESLLKKKSVIYNYNYFLTGKTIGKLFNTTDKNTEQISSPINYIAIIPEISGTEALRVCFINSKDGKSFEYLLEKNDIVAKALDSIEGFSDDENAMYYISSIQTGFDVFNGNVFLPQWKKDGYEYSPIRAEKPWEKDGGVLLLQLEKNINMFFENPAAKSASTVNNVYTYSDESTVVKYYTNSVLEYSGYEAVSRKAESADFFDFYKTALMFIKNDTNIKNEYYLKDYKEENGRITFYFDYKINNFPIVFSEELKKLTGMSSIIEITVADKRVLKYKRYVCDFYLDTENSDYVEKDFLAAIDTVYALNGNIDGERKIDNMMLGYNVEPYKEGLLLNWLVTLDGNVVSCDSR